MRSNITDIRGITLIEILVSLAISFIILSGIYVAYTTQVKHMGREYKIAEADMELGIAKGIMEREITMAGYGLAEDYDYDGDGDQDFSPTAVSATNSSVAPDTITLMGTALGMGSRQAQEWTYMANTTPTFRTWGDAREDLGIGDRVVVIEPSTKKLLAQQVAGVWQWLYVFTGACCNINTRVGSIAFANPALGNLLYGLQDAADPQATQPFYAVRYSLGDTVPSTLPSTCATGTQNLLRAESRTTVAPAGGEPLLNCVLDLQVAFGLDTDENGAIDFWDNGGVLAGGYDAKTLNKRLKQVRVYLLVQLGKQDPDYTNPLASIRVGDTSLTIGRDVPLTAEQRRFRWRVISLNITPRNMR